MIKEKNIVNKRLFHKPELTQWQEAVQLPGNYTSTATSGYHRDAEKYPLSLLISEI